MRSPKLLRPSNQVQAQKVKWKFYFLVSLFQQTCGSSLVSSAIAFVPGMMKFLARRVCGMSSRAFLIIALSYFFELTLNCSF